MEMFNFDTGEFERVDGIDSLDDTKLIQYLPKHPGAGGGAARGLYQVLRDLGHSKHEAMVEVLKSALGIS